MKVAESQLPLAVKVVTNLLRQVLTKAELKRASIHPVFPGVTEGRRAGILVFSLDEKTSSRSLNKVLDVLRNSDAVEYAQPAAPRAAQAAGSRRF